MTIDEIEDSDGCSISIDGKRLDIWSNAILERFIAPDGVLIVPDGVTGVRVFNNTIATRFIVPESINFISLSNSIISDGFAIPAGVTDLVLCNTPIPAGFTVPDTVTTFILWKISIPDWFVVPAGVAKINLWRSTVTTGPIYTCPRGYDLYTLPRADGDAVFWAGCRMFHTRAAAVAHWGAPDYPNKARGDAFVAAINATVNNKAVQ